MALEESKTVAIKSIFWRFLEMLGRYGVQFVLQIAMTRLLAPDDYGVYAIIIALITIATSYIAGFPQALIQDKSETEKDWAVITWLLFGISAAIYAVLFILSYFIAVFYDKPEIELYLQIMALVLFFAVYQEMQATKLIKALKFKSLFFRSLFAVVVSGLLGVVAALNNMGTWALIIQYFSSYIVGCIILFIQNGWFPKPIFDIACIKKYLRFSSRYFLSNLLKNNHDAIGDMIFGKFLTPSQLGFLDRGRKFGQTASTIIDNPIQTVFFSFLTRVQYEDNKMLGIVRAVVSAYTCLAVPFYIILVLFSSQIITVLFGLQWSDVSYFFSLYCVTYIPMALTTVSYQAFNAKGASEIPLRCELIRLCAGILAIGLGLLLNVDQFTLVSLWCGISACSTLLVVFPNKTILNYSYKQQGKDFLMPCALAFSLLFIPYEVTKTVVTENPLILLGVLLIGFSVYIAACFLSKQKACELLRNVQGLVK